MTTDYQHDTTLKLGTNRGNPRVWIDLKKVEDERRALLDYIRKERS